MPMFTFQQSYIWDGGKQEAAPDQPRVKRKGRTEERARKRLPRPELGRQWVLVHTKLEQNSPALDLLKELRASIERQDGMTVRALFREIDGYSQGTLANIGFVKKGEPVDDSVHPIMEHVAMLVFVQSIEEYVLKSEKIMDFSYVIPRDVSVNMLNQAVAKATEDWDG